MSEGISRRLGKEAGFMQAHSSRIRLRDKQTSEEAKRRMGPRSNAQSPHRYGRKIK